MSLAVCHELSVSSEPILICCLSCALFEFDYYSRKRGKFCSRKKAFFKVLNSSQDQGSSNLSSLFFQKMSASSRSSIEDFILRIEAERVEKGLPEYSMLDQIQKYPDRIVTHHADETIQRLELLVEENEPEDLVEKKAEKVEGLEERLAKVEWKVREKFGLTMEELMDEVEDQKKKEVVVVIPENFLPGADEDCRMTAWMNLEAAAKNH